jgi:hypothetical protein
LVTSFVFAVTIEPGDRHGMTEKRKEHRFYAAFFITLDFLAGQQGPAGAGKKLLTRFFSGKRLCLLI